MVKSEFKKPVYRLVKSKKFGLVSSMMLLSFLSVSSVVSADEVSLNESRGTESFSLLSGGGVTNTNEVVSSEEISKTMSIDGVSENSGEQATDADSVVRVEDTSTNESTLTGIESVVKEDTSTNESTLTGIESVVKEDTLFVDTVSSLPVEPDTLDESEVEEGVTYNDTSDYAKTVNSARLSKFEGIDSERNKIASQIFKVSDLITLSEKESQIVEDLKQNFDKLPTPIRNMVNSITVDRVDNNNYGWAYSISGNVYLNAKYFEPTSSDFQTGVLFHEIGHVVDGKSYFIDPNNSNSVDKSAYSFSRDTQVQPLLKTVYPNHVYYEAFASLFGSYAKHITGVSSVETPTEERIDKYFTELLRGVSYPSSAPAELDEAINTASNKGLIPVYQGKEVFVADNDNLDEYKELVETKNSSTVEFLNSGGTARTYRAVTSEGSTLLPYSVAMLDTSRVSGIAPLNLEATTDGYDMTVTNTSNPDLVIRGTNFYNKTNSINRINISTTEPFTLSEDSKLIVKYSSTDPITALVIDDGSVTDGVSSAKVVPVSDSGNVKFKAELPIGEVDSGVIKSFTSNFAFQGVSRGQTITATYELWSDGKLLESRSQNYTVDLPDSEINIIKDKSTEYRVKFNESKEVVSSSNLDVGFNLQKSSLGYGSSVNHLSYDVKVKIPDGMSVTPSSLENGWVEREGYLYRTFKTQDMNQNSSFVVDNNLTNVANIVNPHYTDAKTYGLSFDVSRFGTYDELVNGKQYTLNMEVTAKDEMGTNQVYNLTDTGYIRTLELGQSEGNQYGYTGVQIDQNDYQGSLNQINSVFAPTTVQNTDRVGISSEDYNLGKQATIQDIKVYFDKTNVIDEYEVSITGFRSYGRGNSSLDLTNATFDVLDINTQEKITSITVNKNRYSKPVALPNNIEGIILRPTGSLTTFGSETIEAIRLDTIFTPTNKSKVLSDFDSGGEVPIENIHELSYGDSSLKSKNIFNNQRLVVSTEEYKYSYAKHVSNSSTSFGNQRINYILTSEGDSQAVNKNVMSMMSEDNRLIVMTIPNELTFIGKNGVKYSGGTYKIPISDFDVLWDANDLTGSVQLQFELKPTDKSVSDGQYDLSWYIDWSSESSEVQNLLIGKTPLQGNPESTASSMVYTISNQMTLGTQSRVSTKSGAYVTNKTDVTVNTPFTLKTTLINTIGQSQTGGEAIQYLPRNGDSLGSNYNVYLTGEVTMPSGWKAMYTTDAISGDRESDSSLNYTDTVTDFSQVTAVKYIQTGSFGNNSYSSVILPVKTDSVLDVNSIAYTQVGLRTNQYPTFVESNPVSMKPRVYTESWVVDGDEGTSLKDSLKSITQPNDSTDFQTEGYQYVGSSTDADGNVVHRYSQLSGTVTQTTILRDSNGDTVLSPIETVVSNVSYGTEYSTSAKNVPDTKVENIDEFDRVITRTTTYSVSTPSNATGTVQGDDVNVVYIVTPSVSEETTMKTGKVRVVHYESDGLTNKFPDEILFENSNYGTEYTTSPKTIEPIVETIDESDRVVTRTTTYTARTPNNATGVISSSEDVVTYVYDKHVEETFEMKKGSITQETVLVRVNGEVIRTISPRETVVDSKDYGTEYVTTAKNIPENTVQTFNYPNYDVEKTTTYTLLAEPEGASGVVDSENKNIVWKVRVSETNKIIGKEGTVTQTTVLRDGETETVLSPKEVVLENVPYSTSYNTECSNVPATKVENIDLEDRVITRTTTYTVSEPDNARGTVNSSNIDVVYVVTPNVSETFVMKKGTVTQTTILNDGSGKVLSPKEVVLNKADYGTEYNATAKNIPSTEIKTEDLSDRVITTTVTYTVEENSEATGVVSSESKDIVFLVTPNSVTETTMKKGTITEKVVLNTPTGEETIYEGILVDNKDYGTEFNSTMKAAMPEDKVEVIEESDKVVTRRTTYTVTIPAEVNGTVNFPNKELIYTISPVVSETYEMRKGTVTQTTILRTADGDTVLSPVEVVKDGVDYGTTYSTNAVNVPSKSVRNYEKDGKIYTETTTYMVSTPENASGVVSSSSTDVVYIVTPVVSTTYEAKRGSVTQKTVLVDGDDVTVLSDTETLFANEPYGKDYVTIARNVPKSKVEVFALDDRVITKTTEYILETPENATGIIDSDLTEVVYRVVPKVTTKTVYKTGTVTQETVLVDGDSTTILSPEEIVLNNSNVGTAYTTTPKNVPSDKVDVKDYSDRVVTTTTTYTVTSSTNSDNGTVAEGILKVTYTVTPVVTENVEYKKGSVRVSTILQDGDTNTVLSDSTILDKVNYGTEYTSTPLNVPENTVIVKKLEDRFIKEHVTYTVSTPDNSTGVVDGEDTQVTYIVKKSINVETIMKTGTVTVTNTLIDSKGNVVESTKSTVVKGADYGTDYVAKVSMPKDKVETIDLPDRVITRNTHYEIHSTDGQPSGKVKSPLTEVVYTIKPFITEQITMKKGTVDVRVSLINFKDGSKSTLEEFTSSEITYGEHFSHTVTVPESKEEVVEKDGKRTTTKYSYIVDEATKSVEVNSNKSSLEFIIREVVKVSEEVIETPTKEVETPVKDVETPTKETDDFNEEVVETTNSSEDIESPTPTTTGEVVGKPSLETKVSNASVLPNAGESESSLTALGLLTPLAMLGIYARKRKEEK